MKQTATQKQETTQTSPTESDIESEQWRIRYEETLNGMARRGARVPASLLVQWSTLSWHDR